MAQVCLVGAGSTVFARNIPSDGLSNRTARRDPPVMAAVLISLLPIGVPVLVARKQFIRGSSMAGLK